MRRNRRNDDDNEEDEENKKKWKKKKKKELVCYCSFLLQEFITSKAARGDRQREDEVIRTT
jgi:hypothetical protein